MHAELILVFLVPLTAAPAAMLAGCRDMNVPPLASARELERILWRRVWAPLLPAAAICGALVGWAIAEQRPADEHLTVLAVLTAFPFALVWARALARAAWWSWRRQPEPLAATVGLWQPAVVVSDVLRATLDPEALVAVHEHERVHASHRDPLRIRLAQLATDLQWPLQPHGSGSRPGAARWKSHAMKRPARQGPTVWTSPPPSSAWPA